MPIYIPISAEIPSIDSVINSSPLSVSGKRVLSSGSVSCRAVIAHYIDQNPNSDNMSSETIHLRSDIDNSEHNSILSFSYQKNKSAPFGEFMLELANDKHYAKLFSPGDWVAIYLKNDTQQSSGGQKESLRCLGNISRIQKRVSISNDGSKTTTWQIYGADWGKFFHTMQIVVNSQLAQDEYHAVTVAGQTDLLKGSSSNLVASFIKFFLSNKPEAFQQLGDIYKSVLQAPSGIQELFTSGSVSTGGSFYDMLNLNITDNSAYEYTYTLMLDTLQPLWSVLQSISNSCMNELFLEADDSGKPTVWHRPYPYAMPFYTDGDIYNNQFMNLPNVQISTADIFEHSLGVGDIERRNYFFIRSELIGTGMGASVQAVPIASSASLDKYGPYIAFLKTQFVDHMNTDSGINTINMWMGLLKHWYEYNHLLENGSLTINGNPDIRVGKRLDVYGLYNDNSIYKTYYIEGYSDQWQFPGIWQQSVFVTRGGVVGSDGPQTTYSYDTTKRVKESRTVTRNKRQR